MNHPAVYLACGLMLLVAGFLLKIVFDWLKSGRGKPVVPHAKNGFLTFGELKGHCGDQQNQCTSLIRAEFELIKVKLQSRLDQGDKTFETIKTELTAHMEILGSVQKGLQGVQFELAELNKDDNKRGNRTALRGPGGAPGDQAVARTGRAG